MDIFEEDAVLNKIFDEVSKYDFDIENLAFEGGGAKMAAYFGVVKVSTMYGVRVLNFAIICLQQLKHNVLDID